jgi:hypothetical protein
VLVQTGRMPQADLPKVPVLMDLVAGADDKRVVELLSFAQEMGRPFVMPPQTPQELVTIVRRAFDATLRDPLFLADAERALLEVDPMTGEAMEQALKEAYAAPRPLVQRAAELSGGAGR